jgi:hypothetical protein
MRWTLHRWTGAKTLRSNSRNRESCFQRLLDTRYLDPDREDIPETVQPGAFPILTNA